MLSLALAGSSLLYCLGRRKDGIPETGNHYYVEWQDAQQEADWNNQAEGITDAPRFDDDD